jgi:hypothetical protein
MVRGPLRVASIHTLDPLHVMESQILPNRPEPYRRRLFTLIGAWQARLNWLARGLLALLRASARERHLPEAETCRLAFTPFFNSLSPTLRGRLRRGWRRIRPATLDQAAASAVVADSGADEQGPIIPPRRTDSASVADLLPEIAHYQPEPMSRPAAHPDGHFYSPVVDPDDIARRQQQLWLADPQVLGIDFNDAYHTEVLEQFFPRYIADYRYPEQAPSEDAALEGYYTQNSQFSWLDSRSLFVLMREWRPRRVIEVGSGYSSLLMADVNRRFLDGQCEVVCIEPFPRPFLERGIDGLSEVIVQPVQQVPLSRFEALQAGDILFIDSSHVAKTGSDVNYLFFEVLPRLAAGVRIHIHDIFLPHEYLKDWVIGENRSWNEQYLLRALLMYSTAFRVLFGCSYAFHRFPDQVRQALNLPSGQAFGGGSMWIERAQT